MDNIRYPSGNHFVVGGLRLRCGRRFGSVGQLLRAATTRRRREAAAAGRDAMHADILARF
jgi:hypothetical protein